jgi:hypothetical protein
MENVTFVSSSFIAVFSGFILFQYLLAAGVLAIHDWRHSRLTTQRVGNALRAWVAVQPPAPWYEPDGPRASLAVRPSMCFA